MVAIRMFCGTRIRYTHLLFYLIGSNLGSGVEED
jgi:hypothetical protein